MSMMDNFNELEPKQKVMLVVTIIAFIYVIYLGYDTFFGGSTSSYTPPATPDTIDLPQQDDDVFSDDVTATQNDQDGQGFVDPAAPQPVPVPKPDATMVEVKAIEPTPEQKALLEESQEIQKQYLKLVSEYQIAQLEQRLAETNASIAQAKLKSAITDSEAQKLDQELQQQSRGPMSGSGDAVNQQAQEFSSNLELSYVGKQMGAWIAMLKSDGEYYEVKQGMRLPDGSTVSSIDSRGVILTKNGSRRFLTMPKALD